MKGNSWFSVSKFDSPWANLLSKFLLTINLLIVSKFCERFFSLSNFRGLWAIFCRRQQKDNRAGRSSFEPGGHEAGNGFSSGRRVYSFIHDLPPYCRTFLVDAFGGSRYRYLVLVVPGSNRSRLVLCHTSTRSISQNKMRSWLAVLNVDSWHKLHL